MKCCEEFELAEGDHFIVLQEDGTYAVTHSILCHAFKGIKFCPFCGKSVLPRFQVLEATALPYKWKVWDNKLQRTEALFRNKEDAERCKSS